MGAGAEGKTGRKGDGGAGGARIKTRRIVKAKVEGPVWTLTMRR